MVAETIESTIYFDEVELAPGETREVIGRVENGVTLLRGLDLEATESEARATYIENIVIATRDQGERRQMPARQGGVPTMLFSPESRKLSGGLLFDTYDPACGDARIRVRNGSEKSVRWSAKIPGRALKKKEKE